MWRVPTRDSRVLPNCAEACSPALNTCTKPAPTPHPLHNTPPPPPPYRVPPLPWGLPHHVRGCTPPLHPSTPLGATHAIRQEGPLSKVYGTPHPALRQPLKGIQCPAENKPHTRVGLVGGSWAAIRGGWYTISAYWTPSSCPTIFDVFWHTTWSVKTFLDEGILDRRAINGSLREVTVTLNLVTVQCTSPSEFSCHWAWPLDSLGIRGLLQDWWHIPGFVAAHRIFRL